MKISGIKLPNDPTASAAVQTIVTAHNQLVRKVQGIPLAEAPDVPPTMRHGWLGIVRARGPNGETAPLDCRYWVERVYPDGSDDPTPAASEPLLKVKGVYERYGQAETPDDYILATNLAECTVTETGITISNGHSLEDGTIVRVQVIFGPGHFHYFTGPVDTTGGAFIYKMVITGDSEIATPYQYPARKVDQFNTPYGAVVQVLCPVAHGNNGGSDPDYIFGFQPTGGTGFTGVAWAEVGRSGQWFVVDLTYSSGSGVPGAPNTYYCAVKGNNLTPTAVEPAYFPVLAPMSRATVGWARFKPTDYSFELVIAEEEHTAIVPVDLTGGSGATPTYTATVDGVTVGTGLSPMRPFGTVFEVLTPATLGHGFYSGATFVLSWTNEIFKTTTC